MSSSLGKIATPLAELHRSNGTQLGLWFGCELPDHFGDWCREYGLLRQSVAVLDKNYRVYLEFTGPDRARYLNAILTNNIKDLKPHHGNASLFLSPQGHIQAEIETYALEQFLLCVSFAMIHERLIEELAKYIIMDDVTLTDRTDAGATLALEGPKALDAAAALGVDPSAWEELELREMAVATIPCRVSKRTVCGVASLEFLVSRDQVAALWEVLLRAASQSGGGAAGYVALNSLRLEQDVPWFGYDFGEKQIPHEAGLQNSHISYVKGCYTGQEIVERVRSRGRVNRARVLLQFASVKPIAANTPLLADGIEVGYVTRTGFSPMHNTQIGMAYVRREKSAPGSALEVAGNGAKVIVAP